MSEVTPDARARAGETKKRRTAEKLIHAADYVMREQPDNATVEAIAEDAGVSVPTFYNFYRSRNHLCLHAFWVLVLESIDRLKDARERDFEDNAHTLITECMYRQALTHAALLGDLSNEAHEDASGSLPRPIVRFRFNPVQGYLEEDTLVGRLAYLLTDEEIAGQAVVLFDQEATARVATVLRMAANQLLLDIIDNREISVPLLHDIVLRACGLEPRA